MLAVLNAGLSTADAEARLARDGPNEIPRAGRLSFWRELWHTLASPIALVLFAAAAVSAAVGHLTDAAIIIVIFALSAALDLIQSARSATASDRLRASVTPTATAERDGTWREVPRRELVAGDLIHLSAGDLVPADARLVASRGLHVNQAALTGESMPVEKTAPAEPRTDAQPVAAEEADAVLLGSSVVSGTGVARVAATGPRTSFGDLAARLSAPPPETEFERGIKRFGVLITRTVFTLVALLMLASVLLHRDPLESLLFAVALAVGLVPEFLPMITSVTLASGAVRMARRRVIVKHLAAIENLGSIDVLCSDKTGTLTTGEMQLEVAVDAAGNASDRARELAFLNAHFEEGIHSPLDAAIERAWTSGDGGWRKIDELPFDFERRRVSVLVGRDGERRLVAKGAPGDVLACCVAADVNGEIRQLDDVTRGTITRQIEQLGERGLRSLGIAWRCDASLTTIEPADERCLTFAGIVAFSDPPLPDAAETLAAMREDGVEVKIITGDDERVARHVCEQAGLPITRLVLGEELDRTTDAAIGVLVEQANVFARVSPRQKHRIVLALKVRGHAVGYLGDGINDAPSLHAADVGLCVASAVDVARDASDVVLLDRGLTVLHAGIIEGRRAFGNVMKYLLMGTSSAFGNMLSMAIGSVVLPVLPMLPTQILVNNFLYDFSQAGLPADTVDEEYIRKPHHWNLSAVRGFMLRVGPISSIFDFLTFWILLAVFHADERTFHTGWFIESLATQTLVLLVIRTARSPLRSRPGKPLVLSMGIALLVGFVLPFTPAGPPLGFVAPTGRFLVFLALVIPTYLALTEMVKRRVLPALLS